MKTPSQPLRLRLLNDYEIVVEGLRAMLEPYAERVRVVEADVDKSSDKQVDVTLYDTFGQSHAVDEIDRIVSDAAAGAVVVYTWDTRETLVARALRKGCRGYLGKSLGTAELVDSLVRIGAGEIIAPAGSAAPAEKERGFPGSWPGRGEGLSAREAEVIALITQGLTNDEIAGRLFISGNSLKSYIRAAYRKMGVQRRAQAVRWGLEHGMLPAQDR